MCDWVLVRDGVNLQGSVVSKRPPTAVLEYEMEGGRPLAPSTSGCTFPQHGIKLSLGHGQAVRGKAAWATDCRWAGCCADVVLSDVVCGIVWMWCVLLCGCGVWCCADVVCGVVPMCCVVLCRTS